MRQTFEGPSSKKPLPPISHEKSKLNPTIGHQPQPPPNTNHLQSQPFPLNRRTSNDTRIATTKPNANGVPKTHEHTVNNSNSHGTAKAKTGTKNKGKSSQWNSDDDDDDEAYVTSNSFPGTPEPERKRRSSRTNGRGGGVGGGGGGAFRDRLDDDEELYG